MKKFNLFRQTPNEFQTQTLLFLILLGLGLSSQAWANSGGWNGDKAVSVGHTENGGTRAYYDYSNSDMGTYKLGTISSSFVINDLYLKVWDDWGSSNYKITGGQLCYWVYTNSSSKGDTHYIQTNNKTSKSGNNFELQNTSCNKTIASSTDPSGKYTFEHYFQVWGNEMSDIYWNGNGNNYKWTFTILPPDVSSFQVQASGAVSGDGSENNPYLIAYNTSLTLTASGSKAHTDANSSFQVQFGSDSYSATTSKTISNIKNTTKQSIVVKAKYYNSTDALSGTESTTTIYYIVPKTALTLDKNNSDVSGSANGSGTISLGAGSFTPTKPTRTGYDAEGYYSESGCSTKVSNASGYTLQASVSGYTDANSKWICTDANKTLYTKWTAKGYKVTLDQTGATTAATYQQPSVTYDAALPTLNNGHKPSKDYYDFAGYWTQDGTNGEWGSMLISSAMAWQEVSGFTATVSSTLVWKKADNATVHPKWTPTTYSITYKDQDNKTFTGTWGDGAVHPTSYNIETAAFTISNPSKVGYTFSGWYSDAACTVAATTTIILGSYGDKTFYAKWTPKTTTLILHQKERDVAEIRRVTATYDATFDESQLTPTLPGDTMRTGYSFVRFLTTQEAGGGLRRIIIQPYNGALVYGPSQENFTSGRKWASELTELDIYGDWTARKYTITLNDNGGGGGSDTKTATFDSKDGIATVTKPTQDGYTFAGYYDDQAGEGVQVYDANGAIVASAGDYTDSGKKWKYPNNVTLYAKWNSAGNYVVTLNNQSADYAGTTEVAVKKNTTQGLTSAIDRPTKTGYTFGGYFTGATGAGTQIINGNGEWNIPTAGFIDNGGNWIYDGNQTFKAYWIANQTTITFNRQGGASGTGQRTIAYNSTDFGAALEMPTRNGYTFGGYWTGENGTGVQLISDAGAWLTNATGFIQDGKWIKTTTDPMTIYAKWTEKMTTVTLSAGTGGSVNPSAQQSVGVTTTASIEAIPATGYTFNAATGWAVDGNAVKTDANPTTLSGNGDAGTGTLTATFTETMHTVRIEGGTEVSASAGIATTGTATAATAATGKHFVNWEIPSSEHFTLTGGCTIESETITFNATADDMVVTANYEDTDYTLHMIVLPAGKGTTVPTTDTTIHYEKSFTIKAIPNPGYEFVNWVSSNNGGSADIDFKAASAGGASVSSRKTGIVISNDVEGAESGNATLVNPNDASLTANFQTITYTITYNTNGGTAVADGSYTVETATFSLPTTTKTGFAFAGWYDNAELEGDPVTQITVGSTGNKEFWAKWETVHVYLEGRTKVKKENGEIVILNETADPWDETLKTIEFDFNTTNNVYYLNTRFTTYELARYFGDKISLIKIGLATGDGTVVPYGCNTSNYYRFTNEAKGTTVSSATTQKFEFREVETYESGAFARRGPVMYKYDPSNSQFTYCAPLLTLTYTGATATMTGYTIAKANANAVADGLADDANRSIVYQYKQGEGEWQTWTSDLTAAQGTYKLRAIASGNNDFGQHVDSVKSNEITVTVTTPAVSAEVTHVNGVAGKIIRINDRFTVTPTITGVPSGDSVQVCYKWITIPAGSAIDKSKNLFNQVDQTSAAWTTIDVAGDYVIRVSVSSTDICGASPIIWDSVYLPIHVKGDEITVYAKLEKSIDWNKKYVYHWKSGKDVPYEWPGQEMTYIGKDKDDYKWYSRDITNYKTYAGGKLLFNDSTKLYNDHQSNNVDMPNDDAFYFIKAAVTDNKRQVEKLSEAVDISRRVILTTDTTAMYQYVTITLEGKGIFFPVADTVEFIYTYTVKDPSNQDVTLNAKKQFTPSQYGNYTVTIRCNAGTYNVENTFVLRVQKNNLTLTASVGKTSTIGTETTVTVASDQSISGTKTFTVIEPGSNSPITFSTISTSGTSVTSGSYTMLSSGTYIFGVVVVNDNKIAGKAQDTVTVAAKEYWIKHPFVNKAEGSIVDGDWVWKQMTYNAIDGTYQYRGDNGKGANFHPGKVANINNTASGDKLKEYHIVNPDNLQDKDSCIFVYDITLDTVTVYALNKRLYRIKSVCQDNEYYSNAITSNGESISFFAQKDGQLIWQERNTAADPWVDQAVEVTTTTSASGIYTATPNLLQTDFSLTAYTGDLTVFSQAVTVNSAQHSPTALNGKLTQFTKQSESEYYNHYWVRYVEANTQAMATMGNSINNCIAATLPYYTMPASGNVRYAYDNTTNHFSRTFLAGSGDQNFLRVYGQNLDTLVSGSTYNPISSLDHSRKFNDGSDWIYTTDVRGTVGAESATAKLVTKYNGTQRWILAESGLEADPDAEKTILNKDITSPAGSYNLTLIYDYKTNRLTAGGQPEDDHEFDGTTLIDQLIISRQNDNSAINFYFKDSAKLVIVDKMTVEMDVTHAMWTNWQDDSQAKTGCKLMYFWISLPYKCRISDIYGLGVYKEKFEIQRYRGDLRAAGTAGGSTGVNAWRRLTATATMEANRGYVVVMEVGENDFKTATVGKETTSMIRLFFPSVGKVELSKEAQTILPQYENKATSNLHWNWNIMGNPLIAKQEGSVIMDKSHEGAAELNFVYEWAWNGGSRTYEPQMLSDFQLKSTHSYMVQGYGDVYWNYPAKATAAPVRMLEAAHYANGNSYGNIDLRLNIKQDDQLLDKAYILYRENGDREEYEMGRDLEKIINSGVTQMYTVAKNNLAAICLSSEDKEMIPLTVIANKDGDYTFALHRQLNSNLEPTLYDDETGEYTNLSIGDYQINLNKGTYTDRFYFLMKQTGVITNLGELNSNNFGDGVKKILVKEKLYILRDGKIYNATGSVVE